MVEKSFILSGTFFIKERTRVKIILKDMEIVSSKKTKLAKPGFVFIQTVVMKTLYSVPHNFMYNHLNI